MQSFTTWLQFFLARKSVDDYLQQTFLKNQQPFVNGAVMTDIQDSPAWQSLGNFRLSKYNLVFSLYVDWFNPYLNKIAGQYFYDSIVKNN
jgi:hypothetical protein